MINRVQLLGSADLSKDLGEANGLSARLPEKIAELHQAMTNFLFQVNAETRQTKKSKDD